MPKFVRNKKFCFFNDQLTEELYKEKLASISLESEKEYSTWKQKAFENIRQYPKKYAQILQCENSVGDYLTNCKNAYYCFDSHNNENIAYCTVTSNAKDSQDFDIGGYDCELMLEVASSGVKNYHCLFGNNHWGTCSEVSYSDLMIGDSNCFGCVSLRSKKYCIFNKQYTQEDYEKLVPQIIEHMKKTGEWGEFFPMSISPFAYNETVAYEYFSLSHEQALHLKLRWKQEDPVNRSQGPKIIIPQSIKEVTDEITKQILSCETCGKNYKLIQQELNFYRKLQVGIPRNCPDCRYKLLLSLRNPRRLFERKCGKCSMPIQTTYAPDRPETVYCEICYLEAVY